MGASESPDAPPEAGLDGLIRDLQGITIFKDLPDDGLCWMASHMQVKTYEPDDVVIQEGEPADRLIVAFEGEFSARMENGGDDGRRYTMHAGEVTGMLPYSRMKTFALTARAVTKGRAGTFPSALFPELLQRIPVLHGRMISMLADRVRSSTRDEQQREKMMALGKMSAGLAHELNNPAAAARRAAENLESSMQNLRKANLELDQAELSSEQRTFLAGLESSWIDGRSRNVMDSLERGDCEEEVGSWLERKDIPRAWELAAVLADANCDDDVLEDLAEQMPGDLLGHAIERLTASFTISKLVSEIQSSTSRISELVRSIKEYSYMDQMPQQEIDVHEGIESTLIMLAHRLKQGVTIAREYDRTLPKIPAYGSELNQVWTNLIDNAVDAMSGKGEIRIRTARELDRVLIEIRDNGPGIPEEIRTRIFDPFFTTKPVGKGTGLGLDIVYRIVQKHRGELSLESHPGDTRFSIRLPLSMTPKGETK